MKIRRMRRRMSRAVVTKRYKRKTYRAVRNKILRYKNPNQKEIKHYTLFTSAPLAANQNLYATASTVLRNSTYLTNSSTYTRGVLSYIQQGTSSGNRIGDSTFVKKISFNMLAWICPNPGDLTVYSSVTLRFIVHNAPSYNGGSDIVDFFDNNSINPIVNRPERSNFNIYYDKTYTLHDSYGLSGTTRTGKGNPKYIRFSIPINRVVEFTNNESGTTSQVKKDRDVISLSVIAFSPSATDGNQLACILHSIRMYFTDD